VTVTEQAEEQGGEPEQVWQRAEYVRAVLLEQEEGADQYEGAEDEQPDRAARLPLVSVELGVIASEHVIHKKQRRCHTV